MTNVNIINARQNLFKLASSCIKYNDVITITTKEGNIVMMSEKIYKNLIESLAIARVPGLYESIQKGVLTPLDECKKIN